VKVALYCKCGAAGYGWVSPVLAAEQLREVWQALHRGPGCGPATAKEAAAARRKAENALKRA
jgi:hypothetical protein